MSPKNLNALTLLATKSVNTGVALCGNPTLNAFEAEICQSRRNPLWQLWITLNKCSQDATFSIDLITGYKYQTMHFNQHIVSWSFALKQERQSELTKFSKPKCMTQWSPLKYATRKNQTLRLLYTYVHITELEKREGSLWLSSQIVIESSKKWERISPLTSPTVFKAIKMLINNQPQCLHLIKQILPISTFFPSQEKIDADNEKI